MDEYRKYEPIFGSWYLSRLLGRGSFGKVFEITREELGETYRAALKIITVPQDGEDIRARMADGSDPDTISEYYKSILKEIVNENRIMARLKGNSNIVSYEDHQIIPHEDGIGYDILIRMELLTPLLDRMIERSLTEEDVVSLGIDICKALEVCHRKKIIHRDIKPQNIFISDIGDYKLGDFGISRTMEKTVGGMSKKGTYKYMAPEVFRGDDYDSTVDIYSLGIVLFTLLNGNRGPFLPPPPEAVTVNDEEEARRKRFTGEPLPAPLNGGELLACIIQKACAFDPADRYQTAGQMREDLENYMKNYTVQAVQPAVVSAAEDTITGGTSQQEVPVPADEEAKAGPAAATMNEKTMPGKEDTHLTQEGKKPLRSGEKIPGFARVFQALASAAFILLLLYFIHVIYYGFNDNIYKEINMTTPLWALVVAFTAYADIMLFRYIKRKDVSFLGFAEKCAGVTIAFELLMPIIFALMTSVYTLIYPAIYLRFHYDEFPIQLGLWELTIPWFILFIATVLAYAAKLLYLIKSVRLRTYYGTDEYYDKSYFFCNVKRAEPAESEKPSDKQPGED